MFNKGFIVTLWSALINYILTQTEDEVLQERLQIKPQEINFCLFLDVTKSLCFICAVYNLEQIWLHNLDLINDKDTCRSPGLPLRSPDSPFRTPDSPFRTPDSPFMTPDSPAGPLIHLSCPLNHFNNKSTTFK